MMKACETSCEQVAQDTSHYPFPFSTFFLILPLCHSLCPLLGQSSYSFFLLSIHFCHFFFLRILPFPFLSLTLFYAFLTPFFPQNILLRLATFMPILASIVFRSRSFKLSLLYTAHPPFPLIRHLQPPFSYPYMTSIFCQPLPVFL
jgi:hypothetical protein